VIDKAIPILESRVMEFFRSEQFKELVIQMVLEELPSEQG
jgi:hypothetical protein